MADQNALCTGVSITFNTHNDNKDHNTVLNVSIVDRVSIFLSQNIASANNLGGDMEFVDPSTHTFDLPLASSNIKLSDFTAPVVDIDIQPDGHDRWIFDFTISLSFNDGTAFTSKSVGVILDQDNKHYSGIFQSA